MTEAARQATGGQPHAQAQKGIIITIDNTPVRTIPEGSGTSVKNDKIHVGEALEVVHEFVRTRVCEVQIYHNVFDDHNVLVATLSRAGTGDIGKATITEKIAFALKPGKYTLKTNVVSTCSEKVYVQNYNDVSFEVVP